MRQFRGCSCSNKDYFVTLGNQLQFTLHFEASLLPFRALWICIKRADVAAFILPRHVPQTDGCGVEGRLCERHLPLVRLVHLLPEAFAVGCEVLDRFILKKPLPRNLENTCWENNIQTIIHKHS